MEKRIRGTCGAAVVGALVALSGCAAGDPHEGSSPSPSEGAVGAQQLLTSVNANGTWTADALSPAIDVALNVFGRADFTGPEGFTRKMGVCLLTVVNTACTTVADCSGVTIPKWGSVYCAALGGDGPKVCAVRPGRQQDWCAGSPAITGNPAVGPGSYATPVYPASSESWYISYACFEGCTATDPSVSSYAAVPDPYYCNKYPNDPSCQYYQY